MNLSVFGAGHVGLVAAACFANAGHRVLCVEVDPGRLAPLLAGQLPFYEPGLAEHLQSAMSQGSLRFTGDVPSAVAHASLLLVAVSTSAERDGAACTDAVFDIALAVARSAQGFKVLALKSTVPVGTAASVQRRLQTVLDERSAEGVNLVIASNPEFLSEGNALRDFERPARVVAGVAPTAQGQVAAQLIREAYAPFLQHSGEWMVMDRESAELAKYTANALLATRVSLMNEMAALAERVGADIREVRRVAAADPRIGPSHLNAGAGFGGSCLPKDMAAIAAAGAHAGVHMRMVNAALEVNAGQIDRVYEKLAQVLGPDLHGRHVAVWGLAFKPGTSDVRESPALALVAQLARAGASVRVTDPMVGEKALEQLRNSLGDSASSSIAFHQDPLDALSGADALALLTEWPQYERIPASSMRSRMRGRLVVDGRNVLDRAQLRNEGMHHEGIGQGCPTDNPART